MRIRITKLSPLAVLPRYAHGPEEDAGMDLLAIEDAVLEPGRARAVATGLAVEIPAGFEAQIRPRSGLALKHGITLPNAPGTIDPGYRGEIKVIIVNLSNENYEISDGERIAQMVIAQHAKVNWNEVTDLNETERGAGGFGHTGHQ